MFFIHMFAIGFAGYAVYRFLWPTLPPPGYDIDKNLDDLYEPSDTDNNEEDCDERVDEEWESMTEEEKKEMLDHELDAYYKRDADATVGKGMLLWAYMMGHSQGLKDKTE